MVQSQYLTQWNRNFSGKLMIIHPVKEFMEIEDLLSCSQQPAIGPYPEPDKLNPHPFI
jgi:hypothetical protein